MKKRIDIGNRIIVGLVLMILIMASSCKSLTGLETHQKLQNKNNYEQAMKRNKAFTIESSKETLKEAKADQKEEKKRKKLIAKRNRILAKVKELEEH